MEEESIKSVLRRLANLETHLLNLVIPLSQLSDILTNTNRLDELCRLLKGPVKINDVKLSELLRDFHVGCSNFKKDLYKVDLSQTYGEIKYIGNRLKNIEAEIKELKDQKKNQKLRLNLQIDGQDVHVIPEIDKKTNENSILKPKSQKKTLKTSLKLKRSL